MCLLDIYMSLIARSPPPLVSAYLHMAGIVVVIVRLPPLLVLTLVSVSGMLHTQHKMMMGEVKTSVKTAFALEPQEAYILYPL